MNYRVEYSKEMSGNDLADSLVKFINHLSRKNTKAYRIVFDKYSHCLMRNDLTRLVCDPNMQGVSQFYGIPFEIDKTLDGSITILCFDMEGLEKHILYGDSTLTPKGLMSVIGPSSSPILP